MPCSRLLLAQDVFLSESAVKWVEGLWSSGVENIVPFPNERLDVSPVFVVRFSPLRFIPCSEFVKQFLEKLSCITVFVPTNHRSNVNGECPYYMCIVLLFFFWASWRMKEEPCAGNGTDPSTVENCLTPFNEKRLVNDSLPLLVILFPPLMHDYFCQQIEWTNFEAFC